MSPELESSHEDNYPQEVVEALRALRSVGVDFEEADIEHLSVMDEDELTEYLYQSLLEAEVEDPEGFMVEHNLVEGFRGLTSDEFEARNSRKLRGEGYKVDELDELDRKSETDGP